MSRRISILGSTGSIGRQSLEVIAACGMTVGALTANASVELIEVQVRQFQPEPGVEAARVLEVEIPFEPFPGGDGALGGEDFAPGAVIEFHPEEPSRLRFGGADLGHAVALPGKAAGELVHFVYCGPDANSLQ